MFEQYAPDGTTLLVDDGVAMLYGALHATPESRNERQPYILPSGNLLLWDGRLDNRAECAPVGAADAELVAGLWEKRGADCLSELIGDWSLAVFDPRARKLFLARDFLGTRPLYYVRSDLWVAWSSLLEPLIALCRDRLTFCEAYAAGWLAGFPQAHLTPYNEIRAVSPASLLTLMPFQVKAQTYWSFRPRPTRYSSDSEYEEAFRFHFSRSLKRRLRAHGPVLGELSGGMDSSAIVCVADRIAEHENIAPVETLSFYDDSEPNWNERPYFAIVESRRGRTGFHLNVASDGRLIPERDCSLPPTPVHGARPAAAQQRLSEFLSSRSFRVLLSGIGGDEFTGGVPTGVPELADLLNRAELFAFLRRAFFWALSSRKPIAHVIAKTLGSFLPWSRAVTSGAPWPMPWIQSSFLRRNRSAFGHLASRYRIWSSPPSFQENLQALDRLRRQISCAELCLVSSCEKRYPFLDRDLLEFLFNIPREQLVRPGERRSLLRRALRGIVPSEVLNRPRKAHAGTGHLKAIANDWERASDLARKMRLESSGVLDSAIVGEVLERARRGQEVPLLPLMRVLRLEWWLRDSHIDALFGTPLRMAKTVVLSGTPRSAPTGSQAG